MIDSGTPVLVLGLHGTIFNRLIYLLTEITALIEDMQKKNVQSSRKRSASRENWLKYILHFAQSYVAATGYR